MSSFMCESTSYGEMPCCGRSSEIERSHAVAAALHQMAGDDKLTRFKGLRHPIWSTLDMLARVLLLAPFE